ncbi:23S rRNA (pseudouridine(1915)-N(3))-methyltransferase RlmH [Novosphingobium sp.]|jgi:23S rRNA (pseudouridine1915-N3)-methyltransferase|uniref:23S rRNA (pseudouridine(1915)-N(3))-methyltransferase RlmH n=1 Tax=Novosphingobium sp. TaxID=1874826 RepID=UPI00333E3F43
MQLHVIARGKIGRSPEAELVDRYARRLETGSIGPLRLTELPDRGGTPPPVPPGGLRNVVLDERGRVLASSALAQVLERWRDDGVREVRFWIGAADGHDAALRDSADLLLGFGAMTWPHMLARAMLAEQLWRAASILSGHPYHREG